ncbi:ice-binding family protein [Sphaerochaeta globosa]|uniref:Ig domain protein group 2 domain protein n=1 Tax=Sphaerochaeta globosa (strain ATCC BAA-1886 / DSM 22777 / Buddy) TaxID=158189 RepID=F0RY28_SPHGB|nr:ice-binding family protein [Sphaerochaeta globosa]ADY12452.1 Ig domain protein group 2 domain protein [Sphaerochaeta globosa str. Buddy]
MNTLKNLTKYVFLFAIVGILSFAVGCSNDTTLPINVTGITITGAADAITVSNGETLQMSAAVLPLDATDASVTWSVASGSGTATISTTGLLTATAVGTVSVKATANDDSAYEGILTITVTAPNVAINIAAITGVTAPVRSVTPDLTVVETDQYTATITWAPSDSPYAGSTVYTATITLAPKAGYTTTGVAADAFTVSGADTATNLVNSGVVTAVFPATSAAPLARVELGTAADYVILAETLISTTGVTHVTGDLGISPYATTFITGFALVDATGYATSSLVTGSVYAADMADPTPANLTTAVANMITAYNDAAARPTPDELNLGTGAIGGLILAPGLYKWDGTVGIGADLTLNGDANDIWIFQISGDLNMASDFEVLLTGGAKPENIFWQVAGIATLGERSHMEGVILSQTDIVLQTGSSINGRLLAQTQVTLDAATVLEPTIL